MIFWRFLVGRYYVAIFCSCLKKGFSLYPQRKTPAMNSLNVPQLRIPGFEGEWIDIELLYR
jgi:hypothetical protein